MLTLFMCLHSTLDRFFNYLHTYKVPLSPMILCTYKVLLTKHFHPLFARSGAPYRGIHTYVALSHPHRGMTTYVALRPLTGA